MTYDHPVDVCDRDCAAYNHCQIGGCQCPGCRRWYCPDTEDADEHGRCAECARLSDEAWEEADDEQ